jgi:Tol biopolymer transport system component
LNARAGGLLLLLSFSAVGTLVPGLASPDGAAAPSPAAPAPELIGEGVISTPDDELGATISPDGRTLYFERSVPPHYLYVLYESHLVNGAWSAPEVLPFSGRYRDTDPVLSPDGRTMLWASDRPVSGVDRHHFYIWEASRRGEGDAGGWSEPRILEGPVNDGFNQVFCSIAANGNLYFASSRKGAGYDLYRSRLVDGRYQAAEELTDLNDPSIWSFEATIAPDESYLLIGSFGRRPSYGSSDLYISFRRGDGWTPPRNLGPIVNSPARDYSPRISGDGKWMLYTSERLDRAPSLPFDAGGFTRLSRGLYNTLGNIYRVPLESVIGGDAADLR